MTAPEEITDVYLRPGEFYWGEKNTLIRTLLGSCVSLCFWHPRRLIGGMCHYMLPDRGIGSSGRGLDGRYADEAMELFMERIRESGTRTDEYVVKVFGGASMNFHLENTNSVAARNVARARELLQKYNLKVASENVGGFAYRRLHFQVWNGAVWLKRQGQGGNST